MEEIKKCVKELKEQLNKMKNLNSCCNINELIKISEKMDKIINRYIEENKNNEK